MLPNGLPRRARLHLKRDFARIIQGGHKFQIQGLVLWTAPSTSTSSVRFAVVVSKKLGPAVVRNRTKRVLREAFRTTRAHLKTGVDIIVSPRDSEKLLTVQAAQEALTSLCGKAAILGSVPTI